MGIAGSGRKAAVAFLCGCLVGSIISTAFYVWLSDALQRREKRDLQPLTRLNLHARSVGTPGKEPDTVEEEYKMRKIMLGAVLTSVTRLEYTIGIVNATWGSTLTRYKIFVENGNTNIPARLNDNFSIVGLRLEESSSGIEALFGLLKNLYSNYLEEYDWFLLASDTTYVAGRELEEMLLHLDPQKLVYMGRATSSKNLKLRMLSNEYFCESGPGIVLSNAALRAVVPHLDNCLALVHRYSRKKDLFPSQPDLELGRCFSRKLGVHCSSSMKVCIDIT